MIDVLATPRTDGDERPPPTAELRELEDAELVARQLEGEDRAFQVLMDRYVERLIYFVQRTIGDRSRAEDLVQEAFLRVYRHLHRYDPSRKFSTWLYTIAGNLAKNELRDRQRSPTVLFQVLRKEDEGNGRPLEWEDERYLPDEMARRRDLEKIVEETVDELPSHHREVFALRELEGRTYEEIAELTGVKLGTVKSRLSRARDRFAELIAPKLE